MRARHRLSKFLLRSGQRPPTGVRPWTRPYLIWVAQLRFTQIAQEATRQDYLHEVEHMRERVARLEQAITEAVKLASPALQQVINDLQALRGIADISAVTIAAELGQVSRFGSVFGKRKRKPPKQSHRSRPVDVVTPYQAKSLIEVARTRVELTAISKSALAIWHSSRLDNCLTRLTQEKRAFVAK